MSGHEASAGSYDLTTRRRFLRSEKVSIVAETEREGSVSEVARRHGIAPALLFRWRRELKGEAKRREAESEKSVSPKQSASFVPMVLAGETATKSVGPGSGIEIAFPSGCVLRVGQDVEGPLLERVIRALR